MTWVVMACLLIASSVLQMLLPGYALLGQVKVPMLMALVLYYALNREFVVAVTCAFCAGFIQDALGYTPMGYSVFCFTILVGVVFRFQKVVLTDSVLTPIFFGAASGLAVTLVMAGLLSGVGLIRYPLGILLVKALGGGALGAVVTPLVFLAGNGLDHMVGNVQMKEDPNGFE